MRASQGRRLSERQTTTIQKLLAETDLSIAEIAERIERSRGVVVTVNKRFRIRNYVGRSHWLVNTDWELQAGEKAG
jgi:hypothetical protein